MRFLAVVLLAAVPISCTPARRPQPTTDTFGGSRPVKLHVSTGYDNEVANPLLIVLHGYSASGEVQLQYLGFDKLPDEMDVLVAAPDGTVDTDGNLFWNATDACCDFGATGVDDVAYITGLVRDISAQYHVDPKRVYLLGHSNGGFMSYRLACDHPELFAGIVSIAGATYDDMSACKPKEPVSVLQIHGTKDLTIQYDGFVPGGTVKRKYPGVLKGMEDWRTADGCSGALTGVAATMNIDSSKAGDETSILRATGCPAPVDVELWTMQDVGHIPAFTADFHLKVWEWLDAHAKR